MAIPSVQIIGQVNIPGGGVASGARVLARLSQSGSVLDGVTWEAVAGEVAVTLDATGSFATAPSDVNALHLTPNDAISPGGTYWEMTFSAPTVLGRVVWRQKWQLASSPTPIAVGSVPRLDVIPGVTVAPVPLSGDLGGSSASPQVTGTHLSTPLPQAQGGSGAATLGQGTVTAMGSATPRTLRDWAADINATAPVRAEPVVATFPVTGARIARSLGLRAVLRARDTYAGIEGVEPDGTGSYGYLWIRDYYHAVKGFPGYFTAAKLRAVADAFVATIGGDAADRTAPAERIDTAGVGIYRAGTEWGPLPTFDSAAYLALLVALAHKRGDSTIFASHIAALEAALAAPPRNGAGCLYSDVAATLNGHSTVGWGFEDSISGLTGALGMATALYAWAYRQIEAVAFDVGDHDAARRLRTAGNALVVGLRALRRSDGFYISGTTGPNDKHVMLTALIVAEGLCSKQEARASALALLAEYRKGTISQRGAIRHLVSPLGFVGSAPSNGYQNGAYWMGEWTDWVARSLVLADDRGAAQQLVQEAVDEVLRQHRIDALAPWEWQYNDTRGVTLYSASSAALIHAVEDPASRDVRVVLGGALNSTVTVPLPSGHALRSMEVFGPAGTTVTVTAYAADQTAALADPVNAPPLTFGAETQAASVSLVAASTGAARSRWTPKGIFGGYVRLAVTAGSASTDLTVRLTTATALPAWSSSPDTTETFAVDPSASFSTTGSWSVSGGRLRNTAAGTSTYLYDGVIARDVQVSAVVRCAAWVRRYPEVVVRAADTSNMVQILFHAGGLRVYDLVGGVATKSGNDIEHPLTDNTDYTVTVTAVGSEIRIVFDGVEYVRGTTVTSSGKVGLKVETGSGTDEVQFDDLGIRRLQPVPPGLVVESAVLNGARVSWEPYPVDSASVVRDDTGAQIVAAPPSLGVSLAY